MLRRAPSPSSPATLRRASPDRSSSPDSTTHVTSRPGRAAASSRSSPPAPISMSSAWAPTASTLSGASPSPGSVRPRIGGPCGPSSGRGLAPDRPGWRSPVVERLEILLVLQRVHRGPEALIRVGDQLLVGDESLERLLDELLAGLDVVEDRPAEDEEAAVDSQTAVGDMVDAGDDAVVPPADDVERMGRPDRQECGDLVAGLEILDEVVDRGVGQV